MKSFLVALLLSVLVRGSRANDCGTPPDVENANYTVSGYGIGKWTYYTCNKGYILYGRDRILCTGDGWTKPSFSCEMIKCGHPPQISNGTVTEGEEWPYGTEANYSCVEGYTLTGQETIYCTDTGAWSHPPPNCTEKEDPLPTSSDMVTEDKEQMFNNEDHPLTQETIHSTGIGAWSPPPPNANDCGTPPDVENANYTVSGNSIGNWAFYTCNKGYILYGRNRIRCTENGWTKLSFCCLMIECDHPPPISHGTVIEGEEWPYGTEANYSCVEGYTLTGQETIHCTDAGAWSHPPPNCAVIKCDHPPPISHGKVTRGKEWLYRTEANYSCVEGYTLTGQETIHCTDTGAWSHPPPNCTVIKCGHPSPINNGTVTQGEEWPYGTEASYSCDKGHTLTGQESIYCTGTGAWSHPPPICTANDCGTPPDVENANYTVSGYSIGNWTDYTCNKGSILYGRNSILCTIYGWTKLSLSCQMIKCDHPPPISNGTVTKGEEWPYGTEANYSCVEGYTLTGQETIHCTGTGAWSHPPPNCTGTSAVHNAAIQKTEVTTLLGFLTGFVLGVVTVLIIIVFIKQCTKQGSYRVTLIDEETDTLK